MSMIIIKEMFSNSSTCDAWSLQLVKIKTSVKFGTSYSCCSLNLSPKGRLNEFVREIADRYIDEEKGELFRFTDTMEYNGSTLENIIYKIDGNNDLIANEYQRLVEAIAVPDCEINPSEFKAQAYVLKGNVRWKGEVHAVKLISMQNPITTLKHKFLYDSGTYKEITEKVLSLRSLVDVVIVDNTIYMLSLSGEKLFNMERSYRLKCSEKVTCIGECDIVSDFEKFRNRAMTRHNPRRFVAFNEDYLRKLQNVNRRKKIAEKFKITLLPNGKFDTEDDQVSDKLIKLLCDRGMVNPFDDEPMEVAGSRKWI